VRDYLDSSNGAIQIALLPGYAPDLNSVKIANLCPTTISEVSDFARRCLKSMHRQSWLIQAFWKQAELAPQTVKHLPESQKAAFACQITHACRTVCARRRYS